MIKLGSVNLMVQDIAASERFYVQMLGLTADEGRSNRPTFVILNAANCMITLQDAAAMGQTVQVGNALELGFDVGDVAAMRQKLGELAVVQQMGWGDAIETTDPDGNKLNLYRLG